MGLTHSAVLVIAGLAIFASASVVVPAALDAMEETRERRAEARELEVLRDGARIDTEHAYYDSIQDVLVVTAQNTGTSVLELDQQVFIFDGVVRAPSSARSTGDSVLWMPGETATFTFAGVSSMPTRILLVGPTRSAASLSTASEGVIDSYPVGFELGSGAANSRHFKDVSLSTDRATFTATAKMKNGAETYVKDVLRVRNPDGASRTVQFTATRDTNSYIEQLSWIVRDGATEVGRVDYKAASPGTSFTLAAGASYTLDFWMDLADGSGRETANGDFGLTMVVT